MESTKRQLVSVDDALLMAGNGHAYQSKALFITFFQYMASAFIGAGWQLLFSTPELYCKPTQDSPEKICTREEACEAYEYRYDMTDNKQNLTEQYDLICGIKYDWINYTFIIFQVGGILGSLYYGWKMEHNGRIRVNNESMGLLILSCFLGYFCFNIQTFAITAFLIDFGFRGFSNSSVIYMTEVSSENLRKLTPSIFMIGWSLGQIIISAISYVFFEWKLMQVFVMSVPLMILFWNQTTLQESPKYLVIKKQFKEATESIMNIAQKNQREIGKIVLKENDQREKMKSNIQKMLVNANQLEDQEKSFGYISLFTYKSIRIRTLIIMYIWGIISFSYYM